MRETRCERAAHATRSGTEHVARAVLDAIAHDRADLLVSAWPMRALLAVQELAPRLAERIVGTTGAGEFFAGLRRIGNLGPPQERRTFDSDHAPFLVG
jgi:hypothetical protein